MASAGSGVDVLVGAGVAVAAGVGDDAGVCVGGGVGAGPHAERIRISKKEKREKGEGRRVMRAGSKWRFIGAYFTLPHPVPG